MMESVRVDRRAFEALIKAVIGGDIAAAQGAVDEMVLAHRGDSDVGRIVQLARKHQRGIVDQPRAVAEVLPVPGLRVGSTLRKPLAA